MIKLIVIGVIVLLVIGMGITGYRKAPPDQAYIISGFRKKKKILIGRAGIKLPFFDRIDKLDLKLIPIDVKTSKIPTGDYIDINVDATATIQINKDNNESLDNAITKFLNLEASQIGEIAQEILEGNMREIIGQMHLEEMVTDKKKFSSLVEANAMPDLDKMGLRIISFNVQNFLDKNGVIENLGVDNVVRIQKEASISRANSERDIAVAKAKAAQEANDEQVKAQAAIAEKNAELAQKKADLKKIVDTREAQADAATEIEQENQRKLIEIAETNANIAKAEREAELKQKQIELKEYELDALVRKTADADKYAAEKEAEAALIRRQKDAEAAAYEREMAAKAARAEADAKRYAAEQEAEGIAAVGAAEASAIEKKAEAQKKMSDASVIEMYLEALPQIVANAAAPLTNVDSITMYGEGNSTKLVQDVMSTSNQILHGLKDATGVDLTDIISGFIGGKAAASTNNNE